MGCKTVYTGCKSKYTGCGFHLRAVHVFRAARQRADEVTIHIKTNIRMMKKILFYLFFLGTAHAAAQGDSLLPQQPASVSLYRYRVSLTDKKNNPYSVKRPADFLSGKAIDRRARLKLKVDEHDLPVTPAYLDGLREEGMRVVNCSKWNNTVVVETADTTAALALTGLPYVKSVRKVWVSPGNSVQPGGANRESIVTNKLALTPRYYGASEPQVSMLNCQGLHEMGLRGEGVTIAVIDGGFYNADLLSGLAKCKVLGTRNFVRPGVSVYEEGEHGMNVLSCIAANTPYALVGTAPEAMFYLLVSEDVDSEQPVEEDNWCAAVEYADSVGADIITSSLGYTEFDDRFAAHRYYELDGRTSINSRSASLAASRGLLVLNSAGNSGRGRYKKISCPADATDILTVGAVDADGKNTVFSSLGNTADGRIKPDVMAMGEDSALLGTDGTVRKADGTSFSTPILCGAVACLWQAYPDRRPVDIMDAVRRAGNNAEHPDNVYGYGVPDMMKAFELLKKK